MTGTLTPSAYAQAIDGIAGSLEEKRWQLAALAAKAKHEGLAGWAETMASNRHVRRQARTVREWAQGYELYEALPQRYDLPLTFYTRAARYLDKLSEEVIMQALQVAVDEPEITADGLSVYLSKEITPFSPPFSLADWLADEYLRAEAAIDAAQTDGDIEVLKRVSGMLDIERARLKPVIRDAPTPIRFVPYSTFRP